MSVAAESLTIHGVGGRGLDTLSYQELKVALNVAQGMTNRQTAAAVFLSPKTVEHHLSRIYAKLGVTSRTQLTRLITTATHEACGDNSSDDENSPAYASGFADGQVHARKSKPPLFSPTQYGQGFIDGWKSAQHWLGREVQIAVTVREPNSIEVTADTDRKSASPTGLAGHPHSGARSGHDGPGPRTHPDPCRRCLPADQNRHASAAPRLRHTGGQEKIGGLPPLTESPPSLHYPKHGETRGVAP